RRERASVTALYTFAGMGQLEVKHANAGEIVGLTGFEDVYIGETLTDREERTALQFVDIDPPTIRMRILVNDSPFAGREGKFVTARHIRERLIRETRGNVSLQVNDTETAGAFEIHARGEGVMSHLFKEYAAWKGDVTGRNRGAMVSMEAGVSTGYALNNIQERGRLFIAPQENIYAGMIVGENARPEDLPVNPCKAKHL